MLASLARARGVISAQSVAASGIPKPELMRRLLGWARRYADPPISGRFVGAIAEGFSGALYAGMNLEFPGQTLAHTVHAEGAALTSAWLNDEAGVLSLAITAVPCGYCRHFLREFVAPEQLTIFMPENTATLAQLLPLCPPVVTDADPFHAHADLVLAEESAGALSNAALAAASRSYAPYSGTLAGVAVSMRDGTIFHGRYAENSAFNPVMPALQSALIAVRLAGYASADIEHAVLVEVPGMASQHGAASAVLATCSRVPLTYARAVRSQASTNLAELDDCRA